MKLLLLTAVLVGAQVVAYRLRTAPAHAPSHAARWTLGTGEVATAVFALTSAFSLYSNRFLDADSWIEARLSPIDSGRARSTSALVDFVQHIADHDKPFYAAFAAVLLLLQCVRRRWISLGFAAVTIGGGLLLMELAKRLLDRVRPAAYDSIHLGAIWETPSGHTFITTVLAGLVYLLWFCSRRPLVRRAAAGTLTALVLWVGVIRLLVGTHYPSDIVAGLGLGVAWLCLCTTLLRAMENLLLHHAEPARSTPQLENE